MSRKFAYEALPGRVVFGAGTARRSLAPEVDRLGGRRVLVLTLARDLALVDELVSPLPVAGRFSGVRQHVPIEVATAARELAASVDADCVVCVGGGSTIGTAKAIALTRPVPIVAVPTTYAGSEMTPVWGLTEDGRKTTGKDSAVLPATVIYDPELTLSLPAAIAGPSGVNALAHCVEALWVPTANPVTTLMALEGIRALAAGLVAGTSLEARAEALYGAYLAGAAFAATGSGLHHRICHVLGGAFNLPHAETHTIVLPYVVAFNAPVLPSVMSQIGSALDASSAAAGLQALTAQLGTPRSLEDVGMLAENLDQAVKLLLEKDFSDNARPVAEADLAAIVRAAFEGAPVV